MTNSDTRRRGDDTARQVALVRQGGGMHGAFTWSVLDQLFEGVRIDFEGAV